MHWSSLRLETERLWLRPPRREDFDAFAAFLGDEVATEHLGGAMAPAAAWRSLAAVVGSWELQGFALFSVFEKASGEWVGRVGPWQPYQWPGPEVGWSIRRASWGRGYGPEAAAAAMDWAFDVLGWEEVIHIIGPDNRNSKAVAAKLGSAFLRMGELPAPHAGKAVEIWGQSRQDWRGRRSAQPLHPG